MREYFSFTKKERVAVIALVVVILVAYVLPYFFKPAFKTPTPQEVAAFKKLESNDSSAVEAKPPPTAHLFYFDPNTLSADGWKQLGLRAKTISTIIKFISKGGRFNEPDDLKKIYGLHADEFSRLEPYIRIAKKAAAPEFTYEKKRPPPRTKTIIDINEADTTAFIALPGIGSKLASRIISFREKLGGFHSIEQIAETYGLQDSIFQNIRSQLSLSNPQPRKIDLNTATVETLKQHPYIRWNIANAIVKYRDQHGPFKSVEDLLQVAIITPDIYHKMLPYIGLSPPE